jgi:hypothetical protein
VGHDAYDLLAAVGDRACGDLHVDERTVLAPIPPLADKVVPFLKDKVDVALDVLVVVGDDIVERQSAELFGRVTQRAVERGVGLDNALGLDVHQKDVLCRLLDHAAIELLVLV